MRLKLQVISVITILLLFLPQISVAIIGKAIQEIYVDFYPGAAKVIVKEVPGLTTTTPGILKFSKAYLDRKAGYEIRFINEGYESEPVFLSTGLDTGTFIAYLCCCGPNPPLLLCVAYQGRIYELRPRTIFVINKEEAQALGKIEPLILALKSEIAWVRRDAAEALGNIGNNGAVEPLIAALKDEIPDVRAKVVEALGKINDPRGVEPLITVLKDRASDWYNTVVALGNMKDTRAIELLAAALKDKQSQVRRGAALALGGIQDTRAAEPLIAALKDSDESVQRAVINSLLNIGDSRSVEPLIDIVKISNSIDVLHEASECLWRIGGNNAVAALAIALKEKKASVRARIAFALGEIGPLAKDAIPSLIESISGTEFQAVKTSKYEIFLMERPGGGFETSLRTGIDLVSIPQIQQKIIEEKIQSRMMGGPGYSPTEADIVWRAIGGAIGRVIGESIKSSLEKKQERKRLQEEAKEMQINELEMRYILPDGTKFVKIDGVSSKVDELTVTTVANCSIRAYAYALNRITGEDFGSNRDKWLQWWEKNKAIYK